LIEAGLVRGRWALRDPVEALRQVSRDWRHAQLPLRKGGKETALTMQRRYWQMARQRASSLPVTHFAHQVIEAWDQTLDDLDHNKPRLHQRLDWAIKRHNLFEGALQAADTNWEELGHWEYVVERTKQVPPPSNHNDCLVQIIVIWIIMSGPMAWIGVSIRTVAAC
jgi:hypothetical protein